MSVLLEVNNLTTAVNKDGRSTPLVNGITFSVKKGEVLGIVGESGSGKSMTALSILRLFPYQPNISISGEVNYKGSNLLKISESDMRHVRGKEISMITQEPMAALNPVYTIGHQLIEAARLKTKNRRQQRALALEMLKLVGIPSPGEMIGKYPHEYSGGMRQRVMIAMALCADPSLLIADEPTTALDVTIQSQILALLRRLNESIGMSLIIITHDLGVIAETVDRVIVMYAGQIVEEGDVAAIFESPLHPYTAGLLDCIPRMDMDKDELSVIKGEVLTPFQRVDGCSFSPRCLLATTECIKKKPQLVDMTGNRKSRCLKSREFVSDNLHLLLEEAKSKVVTLP